MADESRRLGGRDGWGDDSDFCDTGGMEMNEEHGYSKTFSGKIDFDVFLHSSVSSGLQKGYNINSVQSDDPIPVCIIEPMIMRFMDASFFSFFENGSDFDELPLDVPYIVHAEWQYEDEGGYVLVVDSIEQVELDTD